MAKERHEQREIFQVSISELAEANPQTAIYNAANYRLMEAGFSFQQFDPIQLAKVQIGEGESSRIVWLIVDGHTKTRFAIDRGDQYGITNLDAYDSTSSLLKNPLISPDRADGQTALSMQQYLRAVIEPTIAHRDIAPRRIAAHLIIGWESMVGTDLASKFSATAAMNILSGLPILNNERLLKASLRKLNKLVPGENEEERMLLESGILQMNTIFQESKLRPVVVHREAFSLIASRDPIIGGETKALIEIYGLLNVPAVSRKISEESNDPIQQRLIQEELGRTVLEAMVRLKTKDSSVDLSEISNILVDSDLNIRETYEVIKSENISESYRLLKIDVRQQAMARAVLRQNNSDELTQTQMNFVTRLSETNMSIEDYSKVAQIITKASETITSAYGLVDNLTNEAQILIDSGVNEKTIDISLTELREQIQSLESTTSHYAVKAKEKELSKSIIIVSERLQNDKATSIAKKITRNEIIPILAGSFKHGIPPVFETAVVTYFLNNHLSELSNHESAKIVVEKIKYLDNDLMMQIFNSKITLAFALQLQGERGSVIPRGVFVEPVKKLPQEVIDTQNVELNKELTGLIEKLQLNQLNKDNLTSENEALAWEVVKRLVKMINGHPDAQRIIENYPNLLRQVTELQVRKTLE